MVKTKDCQNYSKMYQLRNGKQHKLLQQSRKNCYFQSKSIFVPPTSVQTYTKLTSFLIIFNSKANPEEQTIKAHHMNPNTMH